MAQCVADWTAPAQERPDFGVAPDGGSQEPDVGVGPEDGGISGSDGGIEVVLDGGVTQVDDDAAQDCSCDVGDDRSPGLGWLFLALPLLIRRRRC